VLEIHLLNGKFVLFLHVAKHKTEIAFLQGAFESYKGQSNEENQRRIEELRDDLERSHVQDLQTQLNELGELSNFKLMFQQNQLNYLKGTVLR